MFEGGHRTTQVKCVSLENLYSGERTRERVTSPCRASIISKSVRKALEMPNVVIFCADRTANQWCKNINIIVTLLRAIRLHYPFVTYIILVKFTQINRIIGSILLSSLERARVRRYACAYPHMCVQISQYTFTDVRVSAAHQPSRVPSTSTHCSALRAHIALV